MTWPSVSFGLIFMIIYYGAEVGASFWLSHWTNPDRRRQEIDQSNAANVSFSPNADFRFHAGIYALLGVLNGIFNVASALFLVIGSVLAGEQIHARLCKRIMEAPMAFFDTTPLGRITNRWLLFSCISVCLSVCLSVYGLFDTIRLGRNKQLINSRVTIAFFGTTPLEWITNK